ncbi:MULTISPECIES: radical SAM protein [Methanobrevibacter]|jgi:predicted DNA-binding helix-hairpin-helix protein|uniref:radical SAM protein n=1 Tax=Methanobrevibacter TaxID=2172 RepID=UPI00033488F7|nr:MULTISPECIES: radical SAM protein [Methanobrevibacter]AGN15959.1 radical SAM domain-containing protein [Methanobrevibacter sp. AbM4]MCI6775324.1 radical SAM protein [Methanobrevibacter boviskoreani]MCI6930828.1 radical SAM protein [Methanobrevibacter boviskoreani]
MDSLKKTQVLSDSAQFDLCDYVNHQKSSQHNLPGIYPATGSNGCTIPLFKTLMTNKCKNDCKYCINQCQRDFTRIELSPDEIAKVFLKYYTEGYVNGLFLSSGVSDTIDNTMDRLIETCSILRKRYGYQDYIHLKIIPGASKDDIKRSMKLADRVSINIEAASADGLSQMSSTKDYNKDILKRLSWIDSIRKRDRRLCPSGPTTQMIVGANDETDSEILKRMEKIYKKTNLKRSYFSGFQPLEGTEFENKTECDLKRTGQLYHADSLLNDYHFKTKELIFDGNGNLSLNEDPKILAAKNMNIFPLEVNNANYHDLIRVPGIGIKSARKIVDIRKNKPFEEIEDLKKLGVVTSRAEPYIKLKGNYQSALDRY